MIELIQGTFITEHKGRFLCTVRINGEDILCHVPSSSHLSSFVALEGRTVLLKPVESKKARIKFSLFAVKYGRKFVLLNLSYANNVVENEIHRRLFSFLGKRKNEKTVEVYFDKSRKAHCFFDNGLLMAII